MKNVKLLVLSDIHLERVNKLKQDFLLSTINERVQQTKAEGFEPLVVFAGDVNNSTKAYDFISKVHANCVYVAGNHEFWECDYYETIEALKKQEPDNTKFLHNDVLVAGQYIIVGTTLWTDVGQNLNKDILRYAGSRMNDMSYISAKKWYENSENVGKIEGLYKGWGINVEAQKWNVLIEIEENEKAWGFISDVDAVLRAVKKAKEIDVRLSDDLHAKSDWWRITKDVFDDTQKKISLTEKKLTWEKFIANLTDLYKKYSISKDESDELLKNTSERDRIFQKIRQIVDIEKKEVVMLSHHLPFYEEILVGTFMQEFNKIPVKLYNEVNENLFMIRSGIEYPEMSYMHRALRGELERKNDITHIVNYYNDGSNKLPNFLSKNINLWIHGHEHYFRYCDYVKGIQILANPSGSSLSLFDVTSEEVNLSHYYMDYRKIKKENVPTEINKIRNGFVAEPKKFLSEKELEESVKIWALKNFSLSQYKNYLKKIANAADKILDLSIEYVQAEEGVDKKTSDILQEIEDKISIWKDSYNYNCNKIKKMHDDLQLALNVRVNRDFNFQSHYTKSLTGQNLSDLLMGNASEPQEIKDEVIGVFSGKLSFEAKENVKIALKYLEKIERFLEKTNIEHVYQVSLQHTKLFKSLSDKALPSWRVAEKIEEKWGVFADKFFYVGQKNIDLNLDRDF